MRPQEEFIDLTITEAADLIHRRQISPVELTQAFVDRVGRLDVKINSFITVMADQALQRAQKAESELQRGETPDGRPLGRLHGIPLAVKDLFETVGVRTTAGSKFFADYVPRSDAAVVAKLYDAGAIVLGKTNLHEIALGLTTVNPHYGACRNPWALDRVPGGSSGGSAAALAARFCPGALGSDTGGSIRVPAALCGVVGLKPTHGRVSLRGAIPLSWNVDHAGPMARRVLEVAMLLQVIAGYDPDDPYSFDAPVDDYTAQIQQGVKGWRVALASGEYFDRTQPEVRDAVQGAGQVFERLGAIVEQVDLSVLRDAALANGLMVASDAATLHKERLASAPQDFGGDVLQRLQAGAVLPLNDYIQARRTQTLLRRHFVRFFEQYDLLLLPVTAVPAPPIAGPDAVELARLLTRYTAPFNLTGLPALSVPCGFTSDGLPVGLQMVSGYWREAALLRAGYAYEQATDWHRRLPAL